MSRYQGRSRAMLNQAIASSRKEMLDEYEELMNANERAREGSMWGRLIGGVGLPLLVSAIAGGPLALGYMALAAGIGSRAGSEIGEHTEGKLLEGGLKFETGGVEEDLDLGTGFGTAELGRSLEQDVADKWTGFDTKQWTDAATDTATAFIAGGGMGAAGGDAWAKSSGVLDYMNTVALSPYNFNPLGLIPAGSSAWDSYKMMQEDE